MVTSGDALIWSLMGFDGHLVESPYMVTNGFEVNLVETPYMVIMG